MGRIVAIYQKFGLYQTVRIIIGTLLCLGIPVFLIVWQGWVAVWTIALGFVTWLIGTHRGKTGYNDSISIRRQVDNSLRLTAVLSVIGGAFPEQLWFLLGLACGTISFGTSALYWLLSDSRIVNLDRISTD